MRKPLLFLLLLPILGLLALAWSFAPARLPLPPEPAVLLPKPRPPSAMRIAVIHSGDMRSPRMFIFRGGSLHEFVSGMSGILVDHPGGRLLIDTGFGSDVAEHIKTMPWLMQKTTRYNKGSTVAAQLADKGIQPASLSAIILTHAHWDHVSGLSDLPDVPVWMNAAEADFMASGDPAAALAKRLVPKPVIYSFDGGPYLGFAKSRDLYGDGSVVLVPAPGHTPGSIMVFVHTPDGAHYALLGDTVWAREGVEIPAERPWLPRMLVDHNPEAVRQVITRLHAIKKAMPELVLVPAHDQRVLDSLPGL